MTYIHTCKYTYIYMNAHTYENACTYYIYIPYTGKKIKKGDIESLTWA